MTKFVLFSIDNVSNVHTLAVFLRNMDGHRANNELEHPLTLLFGSYKGVIEQSFCLTEEDYIRFVVKYDWCHNQDMYISFHYEKSRMPTKFINSRTGWVRGKGELIEVTQEVALKEEGWTYRPSDNRYWMFR